MDSDGLPSYPGSSCCMRRGWGRAACSAWRRGGLKRPNGNLPVLQEGCCKDGVSSQWCMVGGWETTHTQAEIRAFLTGFKEELRMVKRWNRLPREAVLTPSLGFSTWDRVEALSNVESDLMTGHALNTDRTRDNLRCLPAWITVWMP